MRTVVYILIAAVVVVQGSYLYRGLLKPGHYMQDYNTELTDLVAPDAVLTGRYAPALTIDNKLKAVIYMFGLANVQTDPVQPSTHYPCRHRSGQLADGAQGFPVSPELSYGD